MKKFINRNIKRIYFFYLVIKKINWKLFFLNYSKDAENIVLMRLSLKSFFSDSLKADSILTAVVANSGKKFRVYTGFDFGQFYDKCIVYNSSYTINYFKFQNYSSTQSFIISQLAYQKCTPFPTAHDILFWENKVFMYDYFKQKNILHPSTTIIPIENYSSLKEITYPILVKEAHSHAAEGLHKINNFSSLEALVSKDSFKKANSFIIVQELLNMRKDFRIIIVEDKIVLHYWRNNNNKEWQPTSTSHGSKVDFDTFPEKWRSYFLEVQKTLGLTTGAYDYAWQNDDLDTMPYCLEVSPTFDPNPNVDLSDRSFTYGEWKKKLLFNNSYEEAYINIMYDIKQYYLSDKLRG